MIDAGKAYNAANKQFVSGIRELAQQSTKDEVIEVNTQKKQPPVFIWIIESHQYYCYTVGLSLSFFFACVNGGLFDIL